MGEEAVDPIFVRCGRCDGSGEIQIAVTVYDRGCGFNYPDVDAMPCHDCDGTGREIVEGEPITMEDLCDIES